MTAPRMLIVGLDCATFDVVRPLAAADKLPVLNGLLNEGSSAPLRTVPNMNSAPAWSTFATGVNPGKHGIFYFTQQVPGTYRWQVVNGSHRHGTAFWSLLSQTGYRVGVVNVPMSYPATQVNGFIVAGLDTPGIDSPQFTYPLDLADEMQAAIGGYIIEPGLPGLMKAGRRDEAVRALHEGIDKRLAHTLWLTHRFTPDLLAVVFTAIDTAQHFFWHAMDQTHPQHTPQEAAQFGQVIPSVYKVLDEAMGRLIDAMSPDIVLVMSDHGAGSNQRGADYLRPWLAEMGMLSFSQREVSVRRLARKMAGRVYRLIDHTFPREAKLRLARRFPQIRAQVESAMQLGGIDWAHTSAYCTGTTDDLNINTIGREPEGVVEPGAQLEETKATLTEWLMETVDPVSGDPAVRKVSKREDAYWGSQVHKSPDLLIEWHTERVLQGLHTPGRQPVLADPTMPPIITGGHRPEGILIVAGADIDASADLQAPTIADLAPTILYLYGLPIPADMDGRVLTEAITPARLAAHPVETGGAVLGEKEEPREYGTEEAREVEERLRGLGYIE